MEVAGGRAGPLEELRKLWLRPHHTAPRANLPSAPRCTAHQRHSSTKLFFGTIPTIRSNFLLRCPLEFSIGETYNSPLRRCPRAHAHNDRLHDDGHAPLRCHPRRLRLAANPPPQHDQLPLLDHHSRLALRQRALQALRLPLYIDPGRRQANVQLFLTRPHTPPPAKHTSGTAARLLLDARP